MASQRPGGSDHGGADPITAERFRAFVLLDANFDPEGLRLCWHGDRLVGAAYAVRRQVAMVGD